MRPAGKEISMHTVLDQSAVQGSADISKDNERRIAYLDTLRGFASVLD
jgi:hypothetical protein